MERQCPDCEYETDVQLDLWEHWAEVHKPMSRHGFMQVLNDAANRVLEEMEWDDVRERDAINLVVNVFGEMLDNHGATVEEVMDANYSGGAEEVRSWWPNWGRPTEETSSVQG